MHHITINSERLEAAHIKLPFAVITVYLFPLLKAFFDSKIYIVIVLGGRSSTIKQIGIYTGRSKHIELNKVVS